MPFYDLSVLTDSDRRPEHGPPDGDDCSETERGQPAPASARGHGGADERVHVTPTAARKMRIDALGDDVERNRG